MSHSGVRDGAAAAQAGGVGCVQIPGGGGVGEATGTGQHTPPQDFSAQKTA